MAYCEIKNPPVYTENVEHWDRETDADGDTMGEVIEQLVNNDNYLKAQVTRQERTAVVNLSARGWSATAPYMQRVAVPGLLAADSPELHPYTPKELAADQVKLRRKYTGMITDGDTEDGYATFYCGEKKPAADFPVLLKGVSASE